VVFAFHFVNVEYENWYKRLWSVQSLGICRKFQDELERLPEKLKDDRATSRLVAPSQTGPGCYARNKTASAGATEEGQGYNARCEPQQIEGMKEFRQFLSSELLRLQVKDAGWR
jgi:hypothetical protein